MKILNTHPMILPAVCAGHVCLESLAARGLYVHALPGRLRVEAPHARGNCELVSQVRRVLSGMPGVYRADVPTATGRVLVEFDPSLTSHVAILGQLDALGCFIQDRSTAAPSRSAARPVAKVLFRLVAETVAHVALEGAMAAIL